MSNRKESNASPKTEVLNEEPDFGNGSRAKLASAWTSSNSTAACRGWEQVTLKTSSSSELVSSPH